MNRKRLVMIVGVGLVLTLNTMCSAWPFDLELTKEVDKLEVSEGETVVFSIVVTNHGIGDPSSVIVKDELPAGLAFDDFTASHGTYVSATGLWDIGPLPSIGAPGPSASLEISAIVEAGTAGQTISNTATVLDQPGDMDLSNNTASAHVDVVPEPATMGLLAIGGILLLRKNRH